MCRTTMPITMPRRHFIISKWRDARLEVKLATVKRFWHPGHKSGLILSLSLVTVTLNSASTFLPQPRSLCHNCGLVLGLILLALASVGFSCLGLRAVAKGARSGGTACARSECPSPQIFYLKLFYSSDVFCYLSNTVETGMVVVSQWV